MMKNGYVDALTKLASSKDFNFSKMVFMEHLTGPSISIELSEVHNQSLPEKKAESHKIRLKSAKYVMHYKILYMKGQSTLLFRYVENDEVVPNLFYCLQTLP